ncbi:MGDG synthase family glycosyltransferase [Sporosalibacterium faouarense]|uniref:MGDG synthase family glycosyltransferase n=1 Tax=Sporosalibacterium faouarense TaxID=516123 RepID=UPI00141C80F1|nr:glycosyltransferase [Sporosalibacterium faouarense]MTI48686.1 hypothetical protein [Bacillota bacterium]
MSKVLIFTASTGGGHNQAASALEKEFNHKGYETIKVDMLKETSKMLDLLIADGYKVLATKLPKIYGGLYKLSDSQRINNRITKFFNKLAYTQISNIINSINPDLIIGTHPFIVDVVGNLKAKSIINIPFISIVTDYEAHQTYVNTNVDAYITGSEHTMKGLISKGILKSKIYPFGIPIRREFLDKKSNYNDFYDRNFQVLVMGGSLGVKSMKKVLKSLNKCTHDLKIIVVCGKDEVLRKSLEKSFKNNIEGKEYIIYGFTKEVAKLMDSSDIIITKPGGLTVSESMVKSIPMVIPYLIPGQEEENAEFLVREGVAVKVDHIREIRYVIDNLINNPKKLDGMRREMKRITKKYSIDNIINLSENLINEYQYKWGMAYEQK